MGVEAHCRSMAGGGEWPTSGWPFRPPWTMVFSSPPPSLGRRCASVLLAGDRCPRPNAWRGCQRRWPRRRAPARRAVRAHRAATSGAPARPCRQGARRRPARASRRGCPGGGARRRRRGGLAADGVRPRRPLRRPDLRRRSVRPRSDRPRRHGSRRPGDGCGQRLCPPAGTGGGRALARLSAGRRTESWCGRRSSTDST